MFESFIQSWETMNLLEKLYWCIAIPFSLIFAIQLILTIFGGDTHYSESSTDNVNPDSDHEVDFQFLSLKNTIAFFTIFGWTGTICIGFELSTWATIIISLSCGITMMFIMASFLYLMGKLNDNTSFQIQNTIGYAGTVSLAIPAQRKGNGQIQINIQGFKTIEAITDHNSDITIGSIVEVVEVLHNGVLLVKLN
ncbi:MAG: hypothetical protein N4A71_09540 [Carboxylicivirga sp.]|jgi:membrane protein implicated in regulation of membrane protease activity|nr:hypothetical protein [Carboxylicivirga sp.]